MTDETTYDPSEPPEEDPTAPLDPGEDQEAEDPPDPVEVPEDAFLSATDAAEDPTVDDAEDDS